MEFESLLPSNATPLERAVEQVTSRIGDVPVELRNLRAPVVAPDDFVPWLAWGVSTDLWKRDWDMLKKRSVAAAWYELHRHKGTLHAARQHVSIMGGELIDHRVPPDGFFAAPDLSKEEHDNYIRRHPTVRVYLGGEIGNWNIADGYIADESFAGDSAPWVDDGPFLWGRKAVLVRDGEEAPLKLATLTTEVTEIEGTVFEQVKVPGTGMGYSFAGEFVADDSFANALDDPPRVYTYALSRSYQHARSALELTRVPVGFTPRDVRFERESLPGSDPAPSICAGDFAGEGFVGVDDGRFRLADVLRLVDFSIPSPVVNSGSFAGHSRVSFPAHTAMLQIDWTDTLETGTAFIAGESFADSGPATPEDTERRRDLLDAAAASKRLSDKVLVTFQTRRNRTIADGIPLDRPTRLDQISLPFTL